MTEDELREEIRLLCESTNQYGVTDALVNALYDLVLTREAAVRKEMAEEVKEDMMLFSNPDKHWPPRGYTPDDVDKILARLNNQEKEI